MGWFDGSRSHSHSSSRHRSSSHASSHSIWGSRNNNSSSYYKRRPRDGYLQQLFHKFKRLLRDLIHYARRHPMKIALLVAAPLLSGGVLHSVARQFGVKLPAMQGMNGQKHGGGMDGYYGSEGYGSGHGHGNHGGSGGGDMGNVLGSIAGGLGGVGSLVTLAKMFT